MLHINGVRFWLGYDVTDLGEAVMYVSFVEDGEKQAEIERWV